MSHHNNCNALCIAKLYLPAFDGFYLMVMKLLVWFRKLTFSD